jgi:hypothetical protein
MARHEIATKRVVYEIAGADAVTVRRDVPYRDTDAGPLAMDIYLPPNASDAARLPAVVFPIGYPDAGAIAKLGCTFKEMESFVGWARLVAMSGAVAITYGTSADPAADLDAVMQRVQGEAAALGVDSQRIGVWACSGHAPAALPMLMRDAKVRAACAVLYYPYTMDLDGSTGVAEGAKAFGFVTPCAGRGADDLALNVRVFVARAGLDQMPHLNATLDRFVSAALARNLPLTVVNYSTGSHAFDLMDNTNRSRSVVRQTLAFLQEHLRL